VQKEPMLRETYERLTEELERLKSVERIAIAKAIDEARALGDLKENAEYHAAKEKQQGKPGRNTLILLWRARLSFYLLGCFWRFFIFSKEY